MTFHIPQAYIYLLTTYKRQPIKALKAIIHNNNTFAMATAEGAKRCSQRPPPRVSCGQAGSFCQHQSFEAPQLKASLLNLVMLLSLPRAPGLTGTFLTCPWTPQVVGGSTEVLQPVVRGCSGSTVPVTPGSPVKPCHCAMSSPLAISMGFSQKIKTLL